MPGRLSTHVLDTAIGRPAAGLAVDLFRLDPERSAPLGEPVLQTRTNADGRTDAPLLSGEALIPGHYRLLFHVGAYHRAQGSPDAGRFLEHVPIDFHVADTDQAYHVPLLVSPWAYNTYRGS